MSLVVKQSKALAGPWELSSDGIWAKSPLNARVTAPMKCEVG